MMPDLKPKVVYFSNSLKLLFVKMFFKHVTILTVIISLIVIIALLIFFKSSIFFTDKNKTGIARKGPLNVQHATNSVGTTSAKPKLIISGVVKEIKLYDEKTKVLHFNVDEDGTHKIYNIVSSSNTNYQIKSSKFIGQNKPEIVSGDEIKVGRKVLITFPSISEGQQLVATFILITTE